MLWPAGVAIGLLTLAGLGLGVAGGAGVKHANLMIKGKADDALAAAGRPRQYGTVGADQIIDPPSNRPSARRIFQSPDLKKQTVAPLPKPVTFDSDDSDDSGSDEEYSYGDNPNAFGVKQSNNGPVSIPHTPRRDAADLPWGHVKGPNFGRPNPTPDMTTIYTQQQHKKPVPATTPYPPGPKDTPLQPDN